MMRRAVTLAGTCVLIAGACFAPRPVCAGQHNAKAQSKSDAGLPVPDPMRIDTEISEMLGAWQVGDLEQMHRYYADDATFVSGDFAPPIVGWAAYSSKFEQQWKHLAGVRLDRQNTMIRTQGDVAWVAYQWAFRGVVDGKVNETRGQTTLILRRSGSGWVIVHNHTSEVCPSPSTSSPGTAGADSPSSK